MKRLLKVLMVAVLMAVILVASISPAMAESKRRSAVVDDPALPCEHPKPEPGPRPTRTDPGMLVSVAARCRK